MQVISVVEYDSVLDEYYIVIPQEIIDYLQLTEEDVVEWTFTDSGVLLEKRE